MDNFKLDKINNIQHHKLVSKYQMNKLRPSSFSIGYIYCARYFKNGGECEMNVISNYLQLDITFLSSERVLNQYPMVTHYEKLGPYL